MKYEEIADKNETRTRRWRFLGLATSLHFDSIVVIDSRLKVQSSFLNLKRAGMTSFKHE